MVNNPAGRHTTSPSPRFGLSAPVLSACVAATALFCLGVPGSAYAAGTLRVLNWVDYLDPGVVADFEAETGIDVVVETFTSTEQSESRLSLRDPTLDLVMVYSQQVDRLFADGAIRPFDKAMVPNAAGIDRTIIAMMPGAAADTTLAMPYFWGTTGIGYNRGLVEPRFPEGVPDSWSLVFDPAVLERVMDCGVHVIDAPETVVGAAMAWLGLDPLSHDPADVEKALEAIEVAAPYWRAVDSELINALAVGESCVTLAWSTEVLLSIDNAVEGVDIAYILPDEGAEIWVDSWAIARNSANVDAAHRFVDFLLRPDIAARLTNAAYAANAIPASEAYVDPAILGDERIYPTAVERERFYPVAAHDMALQAEVNSRWMWIKLPQ